MFQQTTIQSSEKSCSNGSPGRASLSVSADPILSKLAEYEAYCGGEVVDKMMIFAAMPTSENQTTLLTQDIAMHLKEFAKYNVTPLVLFEPPVTPTIINEFSTGKHDVVLTTYYQKLKELNITDKQMGTWVLFPEANTPTWHNTDPTTYSLNVTKLAKIQKQFFSSSNLSILLNSRTYKSDDSNWNHGELKDLKPYVATLPKSLIDSFGYQGFPSVAKANAPQQYSQLDAKDFLPSDIATNAAMMLGTKNIWINTGTFSRIYTNDKKAQVTLSSSQRTNTLDSTLKQSKLIKDNDYNVAINLFAKDKSNDSEHTDWSYSLSHNQSSDTDGRVLRSFLEKLRTENLNLYLYDTK
jgi:hypothetical protein